MADYCSIGVLAEDDPTDGENEFITPCDKHRDLAPTGVFHRMEMSKDLSPTDFFAVNECINEFAKRYGPYLKENRGTVTRTFEFETEITL
ncbi:MAG: hypothetical protein F4Y63_09850 [Chloroflexi bacterium]|nr:hypothetical protein [Chloroflexota bacterium]MYK62122.1 hypothetical protein [Chloroflexota bacterium]